MDCTKALKLDFMQFTMYCSCCVCINAANAGADSQSVALPLALTLREGRGKKIGKREIGDGGGQKQKGRIEKQAGRKRETERERQ